MDFAPTKPQTRINWTQTTMMFLACFVACTLAMFLISVWLNRKPRREEPPAPQPITPPQPRPMVQVVPPAPDTDLISMTDSMAGNDHSEDESGEQEEAGETIVSRRGNPTNVRGANGRFQKVTQE